jgi:metallophosphoesterase (TIGR00282 family)
VGDVVGRAGRYALSQSLRQVVIDHNVDVVIANVENSAAGSGLTSPLYEKLRRYGVNLMTLGDHIYKKREIYSVLAHAEDIVKPINLPEAAPGRNFAIHTTPNGDAVAVISVLGRLFMNMPSDSPFTALDGVLSILPKEVKIIVVDVHAEATSEKVALGWFLDGRVSCVYGTHTHIPTADERILHRGTAYITDLGMTGPYDSVIGRRKDRVMDTMRTGIPNPFDVAVGEPAMCGIIVRVDPLTGRAESIDRLRVNCEQAPEVGGRGDDPANG